MFHHLICHFNRITHAKYKYRQRISAFLGLLLQSWQSDDDKAALPARKWRNSCYEVSAPSSCVRRRWIDCVWRATATKNCASVGDWPAPSGRRCSRLLRRRGWAVCGAPQSTAGRWRVTGSTLFDNGAACSSASLDNRRLRLITCRNLH